LSVRDAKIPKWAFEKFPGAEDVLGTQMKSVGEVMAIGRTFKESLFKGLRSLEAIKPLRLENVLEHELQRKLARPNSQRFSYITYALQNDYSIEEIHRLTKIDPWFLEQLNEVMQLQESIDEENLNDISTDVLRAAKEFGLSDRRLAFLTKSSEREVREHRKNLNIAPVYKRVDTCGAEFESDTPYLYSTYEEESEAAPTSRKKIMILGSGPNRIGQGIEFDYCCCHASFALQDADFETIMVNCNPETVSTDYDTSDRLYFEPLTV
jgi:carbamoyl-phosphate synthase large subunit